MWWGLGTGLPLAVAGAAWQYGADYSPSVALIGMIPNTLATIPVTLGYLGAISWWNLSSDTAIKRRLRAVGRMALTNYLSQTVIGVLLLRVVVDGANLGRTVLLGIAAAIWALQLLWSAWWLERFRFGPVEWLWRWGTYRRRPTLRR